MPTWHAKIVSTNKNKEVTILPIQKIISSAIAGQLQARFKTKTSLAAYLGMSRRTVTNKFNGMTAWDIETLQKVADYLNISLFDLFDIARTIDKVNRQQEKGSKK